MFDIGYMNYIVTMLVFSGILILFIDVKAYSREKQDKEAKIAIYIGWVNVLLGGSLFIGSWLYETLFW